MFITFPKNMYESEDVAKFYQIFKQNFYVIIFHHYG